MLPLIAFTPCSSHCPLSLHLLPAPPHYSRSLLHHIALASCPSSIPTHCPARCPHTALTPCFPSLAPLTAPIPLVASPQVLRLPPTAGPLTACHHDARHTTLPAIALTTCACHPHSLTLFLTHCVYSLLPSAALPHCLIVAPHCF